MEEWTQEKILALARGFMESRILLTAAQLNLFSLLQERPLDSMEVADRCQADKRAMTILLDALAAVGLLTKVGETYRCEESVRPWLVENTPHTILPMVLHAVNLWTRWSNLTTIVAGAQVAERSGDDWLRSFIGAMHVVGAPQADRIVAQINPAKARQLLDVGGASGTYTLAFLRAVPEMQATLFDRLEVVEMARERLETAGVLDRVRLVAGDFYVDPLPGGHDLALISAIIHQNSPEQNEALFTKVLHALQPGGRIVIRDHVLGPDRTTPRSAAIFAVNMLTGTSGGNCYTFEEIREGLNRAGFQRVGLLAADTRMDGLIEAFKP
jgi:SAM-dependent methyltransferase